MSRAESHNVGGEGKEAGSSDTAVVGGDGTRASHEKGGGESLLRFSFSVIVVQRQATYVQYPNQALLDQVPALIIVLL